jgi:hypothetical protein
MTKILCENQCTKSHKRRLNFYFIFWALSKIYGGSSFIKSTRGMNGGDEIEGHEGHTIFVKAIYICMYVCVSKIEGQEGSTIFEKATFMRMCMYLYLHGEAIQTH